MSYWIDKVISEIKGRCWSKFDIDWIQWMIQWMKHPPMPPMPEEGVAVVEIEAEPVEVETIEEEPKKGEAEEPKLPEEGESATCPECGKDPCECEASEEKAEEDEDKADGMEAVTETKEDLENPTPEEEDRMNKILDAIKTFFPNENTEDVLVRIVSKLIDR